MTNIRIKILKEFLEQFYSCNGWFFLFQFQMLHKLSDQQKSIQGLIKRSWTLACDSQRLHLKIWFCFISRVFISPHKLIILWLSVFSGLITVYSQTMINLHELVFGLVKREYMDPWAQCSVLTTRYTLKIMYIYSWVY